MREMRDTLRDTFGRMFRMENRRQAIRRGTLDRISGFVSKILGNARDITIYLPPGYEGNETRYPVLYMQDGQNLFVPEKAFIRGQHWRLAEAADAAIGQATARPMIIVGIDHAGPARIDEYTPTGDESRNAGGKAHHYGGMLIEELKPLVDAHYRTLDGVEHTAIGGSSLGGLVSLYIGLTRPHLFGSVAALSPSVWWQNRALLRIVDAFDSPRRPRIWLDVGGREGQDVVRDARLLRDRLVAKGWGAGNLHYQEDRRGDHSERAWGRRARQVLEFLFPSV
jgi:predicted alpha/beta superfamily hydrolase